MNTIFQQQNTLLLETAESINAISVALPVPLGINVQNISVSNSVINMWVDRPVYDKEAGVIRFSGIIPGGFVGKGELVSIIYEGTTSAPQIPLVELLSNTPSGEKTVVEVKPFVFNGLINKIIADTESPEHFTILIQHHPLIHGDKWVAIFETQDKGSGIRRYELAEKQGEQVKDTGKLVWKVVESPVILKDQDLKSFVYIKAVDGRGNERIEVLVPTYPVTTQDKIVFELIPLLAVIVAALIVWRLWRRQFTIKE
jgi:hypothetical protein